MQVKEWLLVVPLVLVSVSVAAYALRISDDCLRLVDHPQRWQSVAGHWADGEVVVLVRHAMDCDPETVPGCINGDEFLTEKGRFQARQIGAGFRSTLQGDFSVGHSRLDRTATTARLAFEDSVENPNVTKPCKETVQPYVDALAPGLNRVFVTHSSCINSFSSDDAERMLGFSAARDRNFGIAAFFRNHEDRPDELLGCVWPEDWTSLPSAERTQLAQR